MAVSTSNFTKLAAITGSIPTLSCDVFKASTSGVITVLSGTTIGGYTTIGGTNVTGSTVTLGSTSVIEAINIVQTPVNLATGDDSYTVAAIAADDVILDCVYWRFSAGACQTAGTATTNITSATNISISAVVSTALGVIRWLDISA